MKDYKCVCHVCEKFHVVNSGFLSTPLSIEKNGTLYPAVSCGKHSSEEVKKAFHRNRGAE